jgi:CheY-like chemotaxis protein
VDKNPASRTRLIKIMCDLGCKKHTIHSSGSLVEAESFISTKKIGVILSDFEISGGSGFDLFKKIRVENPDNKNLCLILVTSSMSQSTVAKAAEEDVDSFVIKPFTVSGIQETLVATIAGKVSPPPYIVEIEKGKECMNAGKFDEALAVFEHAKTLHSKPSLALFYIGRVEHLRKVLNEAQEAFDEGISLNSIHFKCLLGLFEVFIEEKKYHKAYAVVKKLAQYFPANSDRLMQIIRLAVQTENYLDMQSYYDIFVTLDERSVIMKKYMASGMYIAGKYALINGHQEEALQYFNNILVSCSEFTGITKAIISLLIRHNLLEMAEKIHARFPDGSIGTSDYEVSEFLILSLKAKDPNVLVKEGLDLYNKQIIDPHAMEILIETMRSCGYKNEKIAPFLEMM